MAIRFGGNVDGTSRVGSTRVVKQNNGMVFSKLSYIWAGYTKPSRATQNMTPAVNSDMKEHLSPVVYNALVGAAQNFETVPNTPIINNNQENLVIGEDYIPDMDYADVEV